MIKNRLAVLLAERNLKITKVAKDTGISRNTITSTAQNDSKMIQLQTIDVLCNYLGITPNEFFEYYPATYEIKIFIENLDITGSHNGKDLNDILLNEIEMEVYIDFTYPQNRKFSVELVGSIKKSATGKSIFSSDDPIVISLNFDNNIELEGFRAVLWDDLSIVFQNEIVTETKSFILSEIRQYLYEHNKMLIETVTKSLYSDNFNFVIDFAGLSTK